MTTIEIHVGHEHRTWLDEQYEVPAWSVAVLKDSHRVWLPFPDWRGRRQRYAWHRVS